MKHLISLSLKYIRRQKLRSFLTFLCITISVFILSTVSAYCSSIMTSLKNQQIKTSGTWEADLSDVLNECDDKIKAVDIVKNHAAVSDMFYSEYDSVLSSSSIDENGRISYIDISFDNTDSFRSNYIYSSSHCGDTDLKCSTYNYNESDKYDINNADEAILPSWVHDDFGYEVGDKITITLTPESGVLDDSLPQVESIIEKLKEKNQNSDYYYFITDYGEENLTGEYEKGKIKRQQTLLSYLKEEYSFEEIKLKNVQSGVPYTVTMKIAGFNENDLRNDSNCFFLYTSPFSDYDIGKLIESNSDLISNNTDSYCLYVRIKDNVSFDDGLEGLKDNLGESFGIDFSDAYSPEIELNYDLLMFELRGANVITDLLPFIFFGFIFLFIAWAVSRFIIDNAFEISVQERSVQFAILRIMGASKGQLSALIFTEAIFYCLTAVPLGVISSFLICKKVFSSLNNVGFDVLEFSLMPFFAALAVLLCVVAIFISAFTSAMWASRKLSPSEALNFGKPKRKKKKIRHKKSKLNRSSNGFILHYTIRSILSSKSRFVISTIAMALGVLMFSASIMTLLSFRSEFKELVNRETFDFYIFSDNLSDIQRSKDEFENNDLFSDYTAEVIIPFEYDAQVNSEIDKAFGLSDVIGHREMMEITTINQKTYEKYAEKVMGMTYDEFRKSGAAVIGKSPYCDENGNYNYDKTNHVVRINDDSFTPSSDYRLVVNPESYPDEQKNNIKIIGTLCCEITDDSRIYIAFENIDKIIEDNYINYLNLQIYLNVNGKDNYSEALELARGFVSDEMNFSNNYMVGSGLKDFIKAIATIVLSLIFSIWLAGIFSMISTVNTSVLNRQQELMMIRSVGMTKKQLLGTVIIESLLFSSVSTIVGTILGAGLFGWFLSYAMKESIVEFIGLVVLAAVITFSVNAVIAFLASLPGISSLKKRL